MTKEQKIQEAYGSNWELIKPYVNEDGWFTWTEECPISLVLTGFEYNKNLDAHRPMNLKGIENNNGWIKIESEEDLPKGSGYGKMYHLICHDTVEKEGKYVHSLKSFCYSGTFVEINYVTHYQLIEKPKPPIY